jgi:hypothetical protein
VTVSGFYALCSCWIWNSKEGTDEYIGRGISMSLQRFSSQNPTKIKLSFSQRFDKNLTHSKPKKKLSQLKIVKIMKNCIVTPRH